MEDSGLQIITLWGPTIGNFENINLEIIDLPSPKGSNTRVHGGGGCIYIYIYLCIYIYMHVCIHPVFFFYCLGVFSGDGFVHPRRGALQDDHAPPRGGAGAGRRQLPQAGGEGRRGRFAWPCFLGGSVFSFGF